MNTTRHTPVVALIAAIIALCAACTPPPSGPPTPPATYSNGACPTNDSGVTVVVDFTTDLTDDIVVRCALGPQDDGFDALANAGFAVNANAPGAFPGTVCTLDNLPTQGYPYCWLGENGEGGFWSYWKAPSQSGAWAFSQVGAGDGPLTEGSVEGWSWAPDFNSSAPRVGPDGS